MYQRNKQFIYGVLSTISVIGLSNVYEYSNNVLRETSLDAYNHLSNDDKLNNIFTIEHINKLKENNGYIVIDNILPSEQLKLVKEQINTLLDDDNNFTMNDNNDTKIRNDEILWIGESNKDEKDDPLLHAIRVLRSIPYELNMKQGIPMICQLSCFQGGAQYIAHRDSPQVIDTSYSLSNLILYILSKFNTREYTMVLYLNDNWDSTNSTGNNNGNLRLYVNADYNDTIGTSATKIVDISPNGGRVVIFNRFQLKILDNNNYTNTNTNTNNTSKYLLHEVLPSTTQRRYALTLWIGSKSTRSGFIRDYLIKNM